MSKLTPGFRETLARYGFTQPSCYYPSMGAGVVVVRFFVENLLHTIRFYDQIRVYRSTDGEVGVYDEVTTPTTRLPLSALQSVYEFADPTGLGTYWYRIAFSHSVTGLLSPQFDPVRADGREAFDVLSVEELKTNYLAGIDLTDDNGTPLSDTLYEHYIRAAVAFAERQLDIPIRRRVFDEDAIDGGVDGSGGGTEARDFVTQDFRRYVWLQLLHYPVLSVEEVRMVLPTQVTGITFDPSWISLSRDAGQVMIVPGRGNAAMVALGQSGSWLAVVGGWSNFIPDVFRVKYTAGFDRVPDDIKHLVGMMAAIGPLAILGDLILGAGIAAQRLQMDGLMQEVKSTASATNSGYGARIILYQREIKQQVALLRRHYKGVPCMVA